MTPRAFAPLLSVVLLAALAACAPQQASKPAEDLPPAPAAQPAPAAPETIAEADARTHDELGAGREVAPAEPAPEAAAAELPKAEIEKKERELARRERDLSAREAKVAAAAKAKPARAESPAPAPAEPEDVASPDPEAPADDEIAEGSESAEADGHYDEEPAVDAEPEPAPAVTVPPGRHLAVELVSDLSSAGSRAGDTFRVRVARDVEADGELAIPAGSEVHGLVSEAVSAGAKRGRPAKLVLKFTDLVLPDGATVPIRATLEEIGESRPGRKAATVGGGAAAGAVLGRVLAGSGSRGKGTVIGALVGALAGAAIASQTAASEEIEIPAGTLFNLRLDEAVEIGGGAR